MHIMVVVQESLDFIRWERIQICKLFIRVGAARQEADHIVAAGQNLHDAAVERLETVTGGGDSFLQILKVRENSVRVGGSQSSRGQKGRYQDLFDQHCRGNCGVKSGVPRVQSVTLCSYKAPEYIMPNP